MKIMRMTGGHEIHSEASKHPVYLCSIVVCYCNTVFTTYILSKILTYIRQKQLHKKKDADLHCRSTQGIYLLFTCSISFSSLYHLMVESLSTLKNWHHSFRCPEASGNGSPLIFRMTCGAGGACIHKYILQDNGYIIIFLLIRLKTCIFHRRNMKTNQTIQVLLNNMHHVNNNNNIEWLILNLSEGLASFQLVSPPVWC